MIKISKIFVMLVLILSSTLFISQENGLVNADVDPPITIHEMDFEYIFDITKNLRNKLSIDCLVLGIVTSWYAQSDSSPKVSFALTLIV